MAAMAEERVHARLIEALRAEQRRCWQDGTRVLAESYLQQHRTLRDDAEGALELVYNEVLLREQRGEAPRLEEYQQRFPQLAGQLEPLFEVHRALEGGSLAELSPDQTMLQEFLSGMTAPGPSGLPAVPGYEIIRELGRGGMGVVYLAWQAGPNRLVALKMILAGDYASPQQLARFRVEAEAIGRLQHPNIVAIYEVAEQDGRPYLCMEYIEDGSLAQKQAGKSLPPRTAAQLTETLARAVHYAHQRGIVHRDLSPANVLLTADGTPKIMDFGLAKLLIGGAKGPTQTGAVVGTPNYMAPEQAEGKSTSISPAVDVYALGAILYELLTGRPPFQAATALDTLFQARSDEPTSPQRLQPNISLDLATICLTCLQKDPQKRYASALALAEDVQRYLCGEPIHARRTSLPERAWRWCRRKPLVASLMAAVATLLVVATLGATVAALQQHRLAQAAERARDEAVVARRQTEELLERQYVARAVRLMDDGDIYGALPWIVEGLRLVQGQNARAEMHRFRSAAVLQHRPKFIHVWFHAGIVFSASFSPNGRLVVTASADGKARVWDATTGRPCATLEHGKEVVYAEFSPDSRRLVTASHDHTARVWDATTGKEITILRHSNAVNHAAFSPDGRLLVTASHDHTARVWDADTGQLRATLTHGNEVVYAEFSPDSARVVTASRDGTARVWNAATREPVTPPLKHNGYPVYHAAFSPDGKQVVTASIPKALVWDVATGQRHATLDHITTVGNAAFSPDGRFVVTGSADNTAQVWEASTGRKVTRPLKHSGGVSCVSFSPDGCRLATASLDGVVQVWDPATGTRCASPLRHCGVVRSVVFSRDGRRLLTASDDQTARVWDLAGPAPLTLPHKGLVYHATFSPDGRRLATASWDRTAQIWDTITGRPLLAEPLQHQGQVRRVTFSRDGRRVVTACLDGKARVWDAATGQQVTELSHDDQVFEALFSPDGERVVTASRDKMARVWDASTGRLCANLKHGNEVLYAEFSPDGTRVVTASGDYTARVWDAVTGQSLITLNHSNVVQHAAFSPDGKEVVTASRSTAQVWEVASGKPISEPLKHQGAVEHVCFSPHGDRVLTASADGTARVWDAATGQPLTPPMQHDGRVVYAEFSPDGRRVITASSDESARVWDAATGEPITPALRPGDNLWHAAFSPDGRRAVTTNSSAQVWELPFEDRPVADLVLLAQVLTGLEMRAQGQFVPLDITRFRADWETLHSKYPQDFVSSSSAQPLSREGRAE
jgi:WD40 repeat protein/serine/threonine protein kinase